MISEVSEATAGDVVAIAIGPQKKVFQVHKEILCKKSEYFRTAYNGRWKEAEEGVTLEDVEVDIFKVFMHWLYTQQLPTVDEFEDNFNEEEDDLEDFGEMLLKACVFGNRFLVADFEYAAHNRLVSYLVESFLYAPNKYIIYAYENLPEDSLMLKLMVELYCREWTPKCDHDEARQSRLDVPREFFIQVTFKFAELRDLGKKVEDIRVKDFCMPKPGEASK